MGFLQNNKILIHLKMYWIVAGGRAKLIFCAKNEAWLHKNVHAQQAKLSVVIKLDGCILIL